MVTVTVSTGNPYQVKIGPGLLRQLPGELSAVTGAKKLCIVSDSNVWPLYGPGVKSVLEGAGYAVLEFVFSAGEQSKNAATWLGLLEFLARNRLTRSDCILALGGGVVGDLAGFAAASYLRGIGYIQLPTSLLAAVDSSVGGKTAIDLAAGKNLAGAFHQPLLVLCDTDALDTLPQDVFRDGCGEVIKYALLYDPALFSLLKETGIRFCREDVVARCVEWKRHAVSADEFDRGARKKLNLGHTFGHAIEAASGYTLSHGAAVAAGMAMMARAAAKLGFCPETLPRRLEQLLTAFGLPIETTLPRDMLLEQLLSDKKRSGGTIDLIVPREIGSCDIVPTPVEEMARFLEAGR